MQEKRLDIQKAIKRPGASRKWCKEHGYGRQYCKCAEAMLKYAKEKLGGAAKKRFIGRANLLKVLFKCK